jgi:hypothetical protein
MKSGRSSKPRSKSVSSGPEVSAQTLTANDLKLRRHYTISADWGTFKAQYVGLGTKSRYICTRLVHPDYHLFRALGTGAEVIVGNHQLDRVSK